ncbi:kinase-like protein [Meredithblackwellia eburnea MCA 4105]
MSELELILSPDNLVTVQTLSSPSPYSAVQLVKLNNNKSHDGKYYVLKSVNRKWAYRMRRQQSPQAELTILKLSLLTALEPPPIPKLVASFLSKDDFHIVLQHASGGDLWSILENSEGGVEEIRVKGWIAETVEAVEWLHRAGWVHRDLKPHNLLLKSNGHILLTDFGSSAVLSSNSIQRSSALALVGTPDYIAPEVLLHAEKCAEESFVENVASGDELSDRAYGKEVDWWSLGVVVYEVQTVLPCSFRFGPSYSNTFLLIHQQLLHGEAPFFTESIPGTYERIINWKNHLNFPSVSKVSKEAQDFIQKLLTDAASRSSFCGSPKFKGHPWFRETSWGSLSTVTPQFIPPPFVPPANSASFQLSNSVSSANTSKPMFDFSAFFSSPGLSCLRPSPGPRRGGVGGEEEGGEEDEEEFWKGMEVGIMSPYSLLSSSFSSNQNGIENLLQNPELDLVRKARAFETPAKPLWPRSRSATPGVGVGYGLDGRGGLVSNGSSGRSKRLVSDVEAWKEMQEHAWEVGMTARKKARDKGGVVGVGVERGRVHEEQENAHSPALEDNGKGGSLEREGALDLLHQRHRAVLRDLDSLEEKYRDLFSLAEKCVGSDGKVT